MTLSWHTDHHSLLSKVQWEYVERLSKGQEEWLPRACEGWLIVYLGVGRDLRIEYSLRNFGSKVSRTFVGLTIIGKRSIITV